MTMPTTKPDTKTAHTATPGPWTAFRNEHYWEIDSKAHGQIGDACASKFIYVNGDQLLPEDAEPIAAANAHMMAAAPTMLAALRSAELAVDELCHGQDPENQCWVILAEVRAAIALAEGRQS